jgi:BA14K-like protein
MISLKMLSTAAALALFVPMVAPTASFAEGPKIGRGGPAFHANVGGGAPAMRMGGAAPAARFAARAPSQSFAARTPSQSFAAARPSGGAAWNGSRTAWNGGAGGPWRGGEFRHRDGRWWPGAVAAGAVIGGAIAANDAYAYYGGPAYYDYDQPAYYDDQYADDGAVAVVPAPVGGDSVAYCAQRYRSYDPASGTYLGFDGLRHPCP